MNENPLADILKGIGTILMSLAGLIILIPICLVLWAFIKAVW